MNTINKTTSPVNNINESTSYSIWAEVDSILWLNNWENVLDKYKNNSNIILAKKEFWALLNNSAKENLKQWVKSIILDLLTNRPEFSKTKLEKKDDNFLIDLKNKTEAQSNWYSSTRDKLALEVDNINYLNTESNPAWFSIKQKNESNKKLTNYKLYLTIPVNEYSFIQHLLDLSNDLHILCNNTNDNISLKVANNLLWFLTHSDSLVIHFKNKENKENIEDILNKWMDLYFIDEEFRNLWRTKFAADSSDSSFSEIISDNISDWFMKHYWKYDDKVLIDLAIKYAIEAWQKAPKINGESIEKLSLSWILSL